MIDRIPTQILENGAIRYAEYDSAGNLVQYRYLLPADEPTQEGTPLNKGTLLSDTTAALINALAGSTPSTPDAALKSITQKAQALWNGRVQITTGSYTGTGTYGGTNKNSLTFGFTPKLVIILLQPANSASTMSQIPIFPFIWGQPYALLPTNSNLYPSDLSYSGNTVTWYNNSSALAQFNAVPGSVIGKYWYVAIG